MNATKKGQGTNVKANEAKAQAARAKVIGAVVLREQALVAAEGTARDAFKAATVGRFGESEKVEPADLSPVYPNEKTATNRAAELNRAMGLAQAMTAAHARGLFDATELLARGRIRDAWAQAVTFAMGRVREIKDADGNPKTEAVNIVRDWRESLEERVRIEAAQAEFAKADKAAKQAETQARVAAERVTRLEVKAEQGDAAAAEQVKAAESAAAKAAKAAGTARGKADAKKAALPAKALPQPRTEAKRAQDVKAAIGDEAPSRQLLAALLRDVIGMAQKVPECAGDVKALGDVAERWSHN